jgi:hypothetical protein
MSLRAIAETDLQHILEDANKGFGYSITLTDPSGTSKNVTGYSSDIAQLIDPDTGQAVSGRLASVSLRISTLLGLGFSIPQSINDSSSNVWSVVFNDINGISHTFTIVQSNPDRALGVVTLLLELYE